MDRAEIKTGVNPKRLMRQHEGEGDDLVDVPFDPARHDWLFKSSHGDGYSLEECYRRIEEGLFKDNQKLIRGVLAIYLGSEDFDLGEINITLIQFGGQQGIFKVDCNCNGRTIELVVGISRHEKLNKYVKDDHDTMNVFAAQEAGRHGLTPEDPNYRNVCTVAPHYGEFEESEGPYFYIAPYFRAFYEVNLFCRDHGFEGFAGGFGGTERRLYLNGLNQGNHGRFLQPNESDNLMIDIIVHQVETSARCRKILAPSFRAGDYLYSPEQGRLLLHSYRDIMTSPNRLWGVIAATTQTGADPMAEKVAYQLLELLFAREVNLNHPEYNQNKEYFSYDIMGIMLALSRLKELKLLDAAKWRQVLEIVIFWKEHIGEAGFIKIDPNYNMLIKRMHDLSVMLQFQLAGGV